MAVTLKEGDFDLNGYIIGGDKSRPVYVLGFDPGLADIREQDNLMPHSNDREFGEDHLAGPTWTLELSTGRNVSTEVALSSLGAAVRAWRSAPTTPGKESTLRYKVGGRTRLVFGRPRGFNFNPSLLYSHGYLTTAGQFITSDELHYSDETFGLTVTLLPRPAGGLVSPLIGPLTTVAGSKRQGIIQVGGDAPAPMEILIKGPVSNPVVSSTGWSVGLDGALAYDQSVTIDTRRRTVKRQDGADLSGMLTRATFLPEARIKPGAREIVFTGTDLTGTSSATVSWRNAFYGF